MNLLEAQLDFCRRHPVPDTDPERLLRHLVSGPLAVVDLREDGALGVIIDRVTSALGTAPFELLGQAAPDLSPGLARAIIDAALRQARSLNLRGLEWLIFENWTAHQSTMTEMGFVPAYADIDMICDDPGAWGSDRPLPAGFAWCDANPDWIEEYIRVQTGGFSGLPGTYLPDDAEVRRYLTQPGIGSRVLQDGQRAIAALRYTGASGIVNAVTRDSAWRGRSIGRLILDEARRRMPGRALSLNVVDSNERAMALYRGLGFRIARALPVLMIRF